MPKALKKEKPIDIEERKKAIEAKEEKKIEKREFSQEEVCHLLASIALLPVTKQMPAAHLDVRLKAILEYAKLKGYYVQKEEGEERNP